MFKMQRNFFRYMETAKGYICMRTNTQVCSMHFARMTTSIKINCIYVVETYQTNKEKKQNEPCRAIAFEQVYTLFSLARYTYTFNK